MPADQSTLSVDKSGRTVVGRTLAPIRFALARGKEIRTSNPRPGNDKQCSTDAESHGLRKGRARQVPLENKSGPPITISDRQTASTEKDL